LSSSYSKFRGAGSEKNLRALANMVSRFFEPILAHLDMKSTEEVLLHKYSDYLFQSLVSFGGIEEFFENPDAYTDALRNKTVGCHLFFYTSLLIVLCSLNRRVSRKGRISAP
jgi:hypothetical protein